MPSKMVEFADRVLSGEITYTDVPDQIRPSVQHITLLPIHRLAVDVLAGQSKEIRQYKLNQIPPTLQPLVKAEAERVFNLRRSNVSK